MNLLVTGANRGLGLALTKYGAELGHHIYAAVRTTNEELTQLQKEYEGLVTIAELDVTDEKTIQDAANNLKESGVHLDAIINNAGLLNEREQTIEELDIDAVMTAFDVNTLGPLRVMKHFLPILEQGTNQSVINISSEAGSLTNAYSGDYPYGMSKAALNMLSEKLHVLLKDKDIQVLSVHPGWMKTDMGGEKAPTNPMDTAKAIYQLINRDVTINSNYVFVDYQGNPMAI